jgi:hypothetical protein
MTTPLPPTEPLDHDELELARVLRALPGGEPSAALDAKILRASQDALARESPRRRLLWAGGSSGALWGIGSAAAAILAVGIGWRLTTPPDSDLPVPRALPTEVDSASDQEATPVEFKPMDQARREDAAAAAPPPPPPQLKQELPKRSVALPPPAPAPAAAPASPEPFPQPEEYRYSAPAESAVTEPASTGELDTTLAPPAAAASGPTPRDAREAYTERQRDEVLGRAADAAKATASAPAVGGRDGLSAQNAAREESAASLDKRIEPDATLAATAWLERIRARLQAGDDAGARASLRLFVQRHPDRAIPADLRPLLGE